MTPETQAAADLPKDASADADMGSLNRLVISILLVSTFVVILNETIMSVALPHLMKDLNVTASAAQWLTTAFLLTMAIVIPVTGFLIQRINTRPIFILAMSLFSAGTLLCAVSTGLELLVLGRIVQALGTAIMLPLLMTTVMTLVPENARGKTMGNISIVISVAPAIGPTISGFILQVLEWRWMFLLVLPIALAALLLGARLIKNVTTPRQVPLDVISVILSALGFGGLVYGLSSFGDPSSGEGAIPGWMSLSVGAVGLVAFILRQIWLQKRDRALLDLRTLTSKTFAISVTMMAICMMALFGTIILLPIYLQTVLRLDTLQTGFLLLPGGLVMGLLAPPVGRLYDKYGPTVLLVPGAIIVSAVLWLMTMLDQNTPIPYILAGHVAISIGLSLVFTPLFTASLSAVPPKLYSHGSALLGTVQQVAGATGVALFVALMSSRAAGLLAAGEPAIAATTGGIRTAFLCGAIISLFAVAAAFFIRKPAGGAMSGGMPGGH